jgi:DedD protein
MQIKKKYLILSIIVFIAIIIIMVPHFYQSRDLALRTAAVNIPPFPAQPTTVAIQATEPLQTTVKNLTAVSSTMPVPELGEKEAKKIIAQEVAQKKLDVKKVSPAATEVEQQKANKHLQAWQAILKNAQTIEANEKEPFTSQAWVIQVGNYKDKANAIRMVNQLRKKGYPAYLHANKSLFGKYIRVYIGPEKSDQAAKQLAKQIEKEMDIEGIVMSYQPFDL